MSTLLLPLTPAGEGTVHVEAFASYFARLARSHNCTIIQLSRFLSSKCVPKEGQRSVLFESTLYSHVGAGLFGYRERVESYVEAVEKAVGSAELRRCTIIPLRAALANQCSYTVRSNRAWCEQCYRDDLHSEEGPYDRLLWTLQAIERCPEHRVALRKECPSCGMPQRFYHRAGDPGLCWTCGNSLIGPSSELRVQLNPCFGESDLCEVIQAIALGRITSVNPNLLEEFQGALHSILSPLAGVVSGVAAISGSARANGRVVKPNLRSLLRKAHAAGVPLLHLIEDPNGAALTAGQLFFDRNMISAIARIRHPKEIVQEVEAALCDQLRNARTQQIPRLSEIAETCGVSEGFVRHHCPDIVKRYQSHRQAASVYQTHATMIRCRELLANDEYLHQTRHLHGHFKKRAIQLSIDARCGVRIARHVLSQVLGRR